jgi:hypothetical protein
VSSQCFLRILSVSDLFDTARRAHYVDVLQLRQYVAEHTEADVLRVMPRLEGAEQLRVALKQDVLHISEARLIITATAGVGVMVGV